MGTQLCRYVQVVALSGLQSGCGKAVCKDCSQYTQLAESTKIVLSSLTVQISMSVWTALTSVIAMQLAATYLAITPVAVTWGTLEMASTAQVSTSSNTY